MGTLTPPYAASQMYAVVGNEDTYNGVASPVFPLGELARADMPGLTQQHNLIPERLVGLRVPVDFVGGPMAPRGSLRVRCLPSFWDFCNLYMTVTADPALAPWAWPAPDIDTFGCQVGFDNGVYAWEWNMGGCVIDRATIRFAEGEPVTADVSWVGGTLAYSQVGFPLAGNSFESTEQMLMYHEAAFSGQDLVVAQAYIKSGVIQITRRVVPVYGVSPLNTPATKLAARAPWNMKVLSQTVTASFEYHDEFNLGAHNTLTNAPKPTTISSVILSFIDSASAGHTFNMNLYRLMDNTDKINPADPEGMVSLGWDWLCGDIDFTGNFPPVVGD